MKTILLTSFLSLTLATTALAGDFDNNTATVQVSSGKLTFETVLDDRADIASIDAALATGKLGVIDTQVSLGYSVPTQEIVLGARGSYTFNTSERLTLVAAADLDYIASSKLQNSGDFFVTPSLAASYAVTPRVDFIGELGYTFNASNDFAGMGGYLEAGPSFEITETVYLAPTLVHTFDGAGPDETNLNLELAIKF